MAFMLFTVFLTVPRGVKRFILEQKARQKLIWFPAEFFLRFRFFLFILND